MYICIYIYIYIYRERERYVHEIYAYLEPSSIVIVMTSIIIAVRTTEILSLIQKFECASPRFGAFRADVPTITLLRSNFFFTDAGMNICNRV